MTFHATDEFFRAHIAIPMARETVPACPFEYRAEAKQLNVRSLLQSRAVLADELRFPEQVHKAEPEK